MNNWALLDFVEIFQIMIMDCSSQLLSCLPKCCYSKKANLIFLKIIIFFCLDEPGAGIKRR